MNVLFPDTLLNERCLIRASGADAGGLLHGLLSCDVAGISAGRMVYGFLLTPQGRYLHDVFVVSTASGLMLDVHATQVQPLLKRLKLYTLRSDAAFEPSEWGVVVSSQPHLLAADSGIVSGDDPRLGALGIRHYGKRAALLQALPASPDAQAYHHARIALAVPDSVDFTAEKSLLLDYDMDMLGGVNFTKGCYVGQEVTARMHYRGIDRKGIYHIHPVHGDDTLPPAGTPIFYEGKEAGHLLSTHASQAMALLRHECVGGASGTLVAEGTLLQAQRPAWALPPVIHESEM